LDWVSGHLQIATYAQEPRSRFKGI
jgi:hypothetical protein